MDEEEVPDIASELRWFAQAIEEGRIKPTNVDLIVYEVVEKDNIYGDEVAPRLEVFSFGANTDTMALRGRLLTAALEVV